MKTVYTKYYVKTNRQMLNRLARRLLYIQEPFFFDGGLTISFKILKEREKYISGTINRLGRDSKNSGQLFEVEKYEITP